jgi:hypothetical protein
VSQPEREARRERLAALRAAGVDPYPARVGAREPIAALRARCEPLDEGALEAAATTGAVAPSASWSSPRCSKTARASRSAPAGAAAPTRSSMP